MLRSRSGSRVVLFSVWIFLSALPASGQSIQKAQGLPAENKQHAQVSQDSATVDSVEVINGSARRTQVFDAEQQAPMPQDRSVHTKTARHGPQRNTVSASSVPDVEVINGVHWETRRFEGAEDELATPWIDRRNIPSVLIGVASVESVRRRGDTATTASTAPVVIGIASSDAEGHGENAKPIAYRIAPGPPKRPPYHPGPPGF